MFWESVCFSRSERKWGKVEELPDSVITSRNGTANDAIDNIFTYNDPDTGAGS